MNDKKIPLTGQELLDKFSELSHLPRYETAKICGYFTVISSGQQKIHLRDFYDALLAAKKGIPVSEIKFVSKFSFDPEKHFTRPWSIRRGIEHTDRNATLLLAKVSIEELSKAVADLALEWFPDVLGKEIKILQKNFSSFAFQIVGQNWSILTPVYLNRKDLAELSKQFQQPLIYLTISDSASEIGYELYESGILIEKCEGNDDLIYKNPARLDPSTKIFELQPYPEDPEAIQIVYFWSCRRRIIAEEIDNIWYFANSLLLEYEAYDPAIDYNHFLEYSQEDRSICRVISPSYTLVIDEDRQINIVPEFVRVDYFIF